MRYLQSIVLVLLMTLLCNITFAQQTGQKSSEVEMVGGQTYYVHTVEKGQTLYAIHKIYEVPISEITKANDIYNGQLKQGQVIRIPQLDKPKVELTKVNIDGKTYILHKVKKGETLFSIGRLYSVKPNIILSNNPEISANINVDDVIKIPSDYVQESPVSSKDKELSQNYPQSTTHTVAKGESLYSIAKQYNTSVAAIIAKNESCRNGLKTGTTLTIPLPPKKRAFMYHQVAKGETYYSIAKHYIMSTDLLQRDNSALKSTLKEKMVLRIDKTQSNASLEQAHPGFSFHEIGKGETFYAICKQYEIVPKKLKKLNATLDENALVVGTILKVPASKYIIVEKDSIAVQPADTLPAVFSCDSLVADSTDTVSIAMLLPLYLVANDTISLSENIISRQEKVYKKSLPFVEFYEGVLTALDTLKKQGYAIDLKVFDTEKDTNTTKAALLDIDFETTDLIIGPVYNSTFSIASKIAKKHNVPIVSPLSSSTSSIVDNPFSIIVNTPQKYRIETASLYVSQKTDYNFLMIHSGGVKDFELMDTYKEVLFSSFADSAIFADVVFKELNFNEQGIEGVQDALSISSKNIVIVPSQKQGFVNNIVTQLYQFHKKYDIDLMGLSVWEKYDNIELEYLFGLNYHFGTNYYVNYELAPVKNYVESYRKIFKSEPTKYSFHGYDIMNYFTRAILKYPGFTCECIENFHYNGLQSNFQIQQFEEGKGLVNTNVSLIKYNEDYKSELVEFDAISARKAFYEKQKEESKEEPIFEELFTE